MDLNFSCDYQTFSASNGPYAQGDPLYDFSELMSNDPLAIGPLLLVCHHWNEVICSSPLLWSRISVYLVPCPSAVKRWVNYATAATRYSGDTLLHIDITFPSHYDLGSLLSMKFLDLSPQFIYTDGWYIKDIGLTKPDDIFQEITYWLNTAYENSTMPLFILEKANSTIYDGITSILDPVTSHLFRLRSLALRFHADNFTDCLHDDTYIYFPAMFSLGATTTPMLEELTIVNEGSGSNTGDEIFTDPIPSLIRLSWGVAWPVTTVLAPAPLGKPTHLRLLVHGDLPSSEYTSGITTCFSIGA